VTLVARRRIVPRRRRARILTGWKAIIPCSVAHGGPGSERHLRRLGKHGIPIFRPVGGGVVRANEAKLVLWLETRYVPIGAEQIGKRFQRKKPKRADVSGGVRSGPKPARKQR